MNDQDLTEKLREKYVSELPSRKNRTVEEALQEALNNTTPEHAGTPDFDQDETKESTEPEWI
jgi:hypothetical protein